MEIKNRSEEINLIMCAFAKAQGAYKKLIANEYCAGGKFANLEAILDSCREALSLNGLAFYQYIELLDEGNGASLLITMLGHESGQYISSRCRVVSGKTDKQTGNTLEIHKRLQALLVLGISPLGDPISKDDNGDDQSDEVLIDSLKKPAITRVIDRQEVLSRHQYKEICIEIGTDTELTQDILTTYRVDSLNDLPASEYHMILKQIRKIRSYKV